MHLSWNLLPRALPSEKRQCLRWCPGWWHQVRQSGAALFLIAQMSKDAVNNVLFLDARDDSDSPTATITDLYVNKVNRCVASRESTLGYIENALQALSPGHTR